MNGSRAGDRLEAVILGRIVAPGDHDGAVGLEMDSRIIQHRSRHHADVGHLAAGRLEPRHQRIAQPLRAQPAVASDVDVLAVAPLKVCPDAASQILDIGVRQLRIGDPADVVFAENGRLEHTFEV